MSSRAVPIPPTLPPLTPADIRQLRGELSRPRFAAVLGVSPNTVYRWELPPDNPHHLTPSAAARQLLAHLKESGVSAPAPRAGPRLLPPLPDAPPPPPPRQPESPALSWGGTVLERGPLREAYALLADARYEEARAALAVLAQGALSRDTRAEAAALAARAALLGRGDAHAALLALGPFIEPVRRGELGAHASALVELWQGFALGWPDGRHHDRPRAIALLHGARSAMARLEERGAVFWAELALGLVHFTLHELSEARRHLHEALLHDFQGVRAAGLIWRHEAAAHLARLDNDLRRSILEHGKVLPLATPRGDRYARARALAFIAERRMEAGDPPAEVLAAGGQAQTLLAELGEPLEHATRAMLRAMGEASFGLGQFDALQALVAPAVERLQAAGGSPYFLRELLGRACLRQGDLAGARRELRACRALTGPVERTVGLVMADQLEAGLLSAEGRPLEAAAAWERARGAAEQLGSLPLRGHCEVGRTEALVQAGQDGAAREALAGAERDLAAVRVPWLHARLARARARVLYAEGRVAAARAQLELAADALAHAGDPWEARACARQLEEWPLPASPPGAAVPGTALERLCALSAGGPERVLEGLCAVLGELRPPVAAGVFERSGACVAGDPGLGSGAPHEELSFGDRLGRRYHLRVRHSGGAEGGVPTDLRPLLAVAELALEAARLRAGEGAAPEPPPAALTEEGLVVGSPAMRAVVEAVRRLRTSRATVLVLGESGVGKERVARAIHQVSGRPGRLVSFNCAAVPAQLFEAQLFGHVRGAFTGAEREAPGYARAADRGTLFLDEVGELPLEVQPKLLRFLEEGEVHPLGAAHPVRVDVRVVAATHRDLQQLVREGRFREDLFYRLHVVPLRVPPLRERPEEVPLLAAHILTQLFGPDAPHLSEDALAALSAFPWPGNVRQLRNELERVVALHGRVPVIPLEQLSAEVQRGG